MAVRLQEAEEQVEASDAKSSSQEKSKHRLQSETEDLVVDLERSTAARYVLSFMDYKLRKKLQYHINVYRQSQNVTYQYLFLFLTEEISDLNDQIGQGSKTIHELEKIKKGLDLEKTEIQAALEEAEVWIFFVSANFCSWKPEIKNLSHINVMPENIPVHWLKHCVMNVKRRSILMIIIVILKKQSG